jgi:hypothetical protein
MYSQFIKTSAPSAAAVEAEFAALQCPQRECVDCQRLISEAGTAELVSIAPAVVALQRSQERPSAHFISACIDLARRIENHDAGCAAAGELYQNSLRLARRAADPFLEAHVLLHLGDHLEASGRRPQAAACYEGGVKLFRVHFCEDSPRMLPYLAVLARLYEGLGWREEAEATRGELRDGLLRHAGTDAAFEAVLESDCERDAVPAAEAAGVPVAQNALAGRNSIGDVITLLRRGQHAAALGDLTLGKGSLLSAHLLLDDRSIAPRELPILVQVLSELGTVCGRRGDREEADYYGAYAARLAAELSPAYRGLALQAIRERREAIGDGPEFGRERARLDCWLAEFGDDER